MEKVSFRGRGINVDFTERFKGSRIFSELYQKHKDELIIGVRDGYINLYYNCDSIAKIYANTQKNHKDLKANISSYYVKEESDTSKSKTIIIDESELLDKYDLIKERSKRRMKLEKQAQEKLFIANNSNTSSNWYCIDLEYTRSHTNWRYDIIALSKTTPYRVALIELKYGNKAIGGTSGIRKHVKDFHDFWNNNGIEQLKPEILSIIKTLDLLGVKDIPRNIKNLSEKDKLYPEFYVITLDNNSHSKSNKGSTPKQTMGGYLFDKSRENPWQTKPKHFSKEIKLSGDYYDLIENDHTFKMAFLFSTSKLPDLDITDIVDDSHYDKETLTNFRI